MKVLITLRYVAPLLLLFGAVSHLRADDAPPPTRAARLTYLKGNVTVTQPGEAESIPAQMNLPLLSGVLLSTADDGQAEVEFEDGSIVRLTPNSALDIESLTLQSDGVATSKLRLEHGVAFAELRATDLYRYSFAAGDDLLRPVENTTVRVDFDAPPPTFSVLAGSIRIEGPLGLQADVRAGENLRPDAQDPGQYHRNQGITEDSWNQWNEDMDRDAGAGDDGSTTDVRSNYAGEQGYGWSDLDANGTWYDTGSGPVWQPYVADDAGFDPYSNGSWVAYSTVGYVWASSYRWGWTPYRCGDWSYHQGFGWGWSPGSSCGTIGWRFHRGGQPVNIASAPESYRPIRVPSPGHGVQRPILRVEPAHTIVAGRPRHDEHLGFREIEGKTATRIEPNHDVRRNSTATSALQRDFPVDTRTRQAILGRQNPRAPVVQTWPAQGPSSIGTARPAAPIDASGRVDQPVYRIQSRPANGPPAATTPAERQAYRDQRRNSGSPAPVQTYSPAPGTAAPSEPTYTPPPSVVTGGPPRRIHDQPPVVIMGGQTHPAYTPASPSATQTHPVYSPPPSAVSGSQTHPAYTPPPQPHPTYTPPPAQSHPVYAPPPAAGPRPSAPPPAASGGEPGPAMRSGRGR